MSDLTVLLKHAQQGEPEAVSRLMEVLYRELHELAGRLLDSWVGQTLEPTALVHELYLKLVDQSLAHVNDRQHFFALAARCMRHALIDHVRAKGRAKRGGDLKHVHFSTRLAPGVTLRADFGDLSDALDRLAALDPRAAQVVELRFFGGLTEPEAAAHLGVSERSVRNDWAMARAWLRDALRDDDGAPA
ncbi:MAG: hypothetical protein CHACPFDD_01584 [Phycisphaerae bacterium]|nr:hypothetical protein [Phycisphaerae bacterium]